MDWTAFSFFWLAVALVILVWIGRWTHRHLQGTMLLLSGEPEAAVVLYAIPLLPGVIIHELSHVLMALLLGARVRGFSLRPRRTKGGTQLGMVSIEETDLVRASLIGLAPLLTGSALILWIGYQVFNIGVAEDVLLAGDWGAGLTGMLDQLLHTQDFWLWAYLVFSVSNTMLPSESDRQAWGPLILLLLAVGLTVWALGPDPSLLTRLAFTLMTPLRWLAAICTLTIALDIPFALLIALAEKALERIRQQKVEYT